MTRSSFSMVAALGGACSLVAVAPALASTTKVENGVVRYIAAPGETNQLSVASGFGYYVQFQEGMWGSPLVITPEAPCTPGQFNGPVVTTPFNFATCPGAGVHSISVELGDGDDVYSGPVKHPARVDGGDGDDVISAFEKPATLLGGAGDDYLNGGDAKDVLDGGSGADMMQGDDPYSVAPPAKDDLVDYSSRTAAVTVTLDNAANDGEAGEGDNVHSDVDDIDGGSGDDSLTGNALANRIDGGAGDDTIDGGTGEDTLIGGDGDDTIKALDGAADDISCGAGDDTVVLPDAEDVIAGDCESVLDGGPAGPGPEPARPLPLIQPAAPLTVTLTVVRPKAAAIAKRGLRFNVKCSNTCTVAADVRVSRAVARSLGLKSVVIGRLSGSRLPAGSSAVTVKLNAKARKALHGRTLTVNVTATDAAGNAKTATASLKARG